SNDADEIRRQVEFYFSDSNLPIDQYLLTETGGHKNRPVPLKVIHGFKRMRHFQPYGAVRDAVKESKFLDVDDHDEITRKKPLSDKFSDDANENRALVHTSSMPRSIYAKGFGEETKTTHLDIEQFFAPYGPISSVRLRRKDDGEFKGSVFVEFETEELQKQFVELDTKPQWNGKDLEIMGKQEYVDVKHQGILDGTVRPKSPGSRGRGNNRRYDGGRRDRRGSFDKDDWKNRR
ncbi:winged helix DNA-binding domain-containing protein, partial [Teratosphaeria nubilosa]